MESPDPRKCWSNIRNLFLLLVLQALKKSPLRIRAGCCLCFEGNGSSSRDPGCRTCRQHLLASPRKPAVPVGCGSKYDQLLNGRGWRCHPKASRFDFSMRAVKFIGGIFLGSCLASCRKMGEKVGNNVLH